MVAHRIPLKMKVLEDCLSIRFDSLCLPKVLHKAWQSLKWNLSYHHQKQENSITNSKLLHI